MRLATITNWAYGATVVLTLMSGTTMLFASAAQQRERAAVAQRYELDKATSYMLEEVEMLSGLARQYAVNASPADLAAYQRELKELRAIEERTRHIRDIGASTDELRALHDAMRWADALQDEQQAAITAARKGDRPTAIHILFSPEYERELDRARTNVERFQYRLDERTEAALRSATEVARLWRGVSEVMLGVTAFLFLFVLYFVFRRRVLHPVVKLSDVISRLAAQDYAAEAPKYDQIDEIGDMAQALRVFRENGLERQRLEQERDSDRAVRDLLSRMTQRMQGCDTLEELKSVIRRFIPEVAPQLSGRLYLLDASRNVMVEACAWSNPVHSRAEFPVAACWGLRRGSAHRATGEAIDVPCDHLRVEGGDVPDVICLPLTSQHGTLGLLYFEPQPGIPLSGISDVYLTMLTENIGLALDNLRLRDALRDLAMADPLTTLANRRQLDEALEHHLSQSRQQGTPISCVMIDVDHFKRFNDEYGHDAGDTVLKVVADTLKKSVRQEDLVFRYGGEEFLLLMPGMEVEGAAHRAEEIRAAVSALHVHHEGVKLGSVTVSLGVASAPLLCGQDRLVQTADAALLRAKREGRNRVVVAEARRRNRSAA